MQCFNILLHTIFIMIITGHRKIIFHIEIYKIYSITIFHSKKKNALGRHKIYII